MLIDLNAERSARAAKREGRGDIIEVPFGEDTYVLPAELPATVVDMLLDPQVEIAQLFIMTLRNIKSGPANDNAIALIADVLTDAPSLPLGFVRAVRAATQELFGEEQWERFQAQKPSVEDFGALVWGLIKAYGAGLGEAFSSSAPATPGGTTSSVTSSASTDSTPEASGPGRQIPDSLASAV